MSYQSIYCALRAQGLSEAGALGMLGNWDCESNCEANRLQGDFNPFRTASKQYVADVTNGNISRETFGGDGRGFGLYQLTYYSRKLGYYDFWKMSGKPLDDENLQVEYAAKELRRDFPGLMAFLEETRDVYEATSRICREFERPAFCNIDARFASAQKIKSQIDLTWAPDGKTDGDSEQATYEPWRPRMICEGMDGPDVAVLQWLLYSNGYIIPQIDGEFVHELTESVKKYQADNKLAVDGVVGPKTWAKLGVIV